MISLERVESKTRVDDAYIQIPPSVNPTYASPKALAAAFKRSLMALGSAKAARRKYQRKGKTEELWETYKKARNN